MAHVCPWWLGYFLIIPLRRWRQDPRKTLAPYVHEGMTLLEPGPGMGFFTLELARLAGESGRIMAVDIQSKMLEKLQRRAEKRGLRDRIEMRVAHADSMGLADRKGTFDFALAFAMVHELPSVALFFCETDEALRPGALLLLAEPRGHVKTAQFEAELQAAAAVGFTVVERPAISGSHAALLRICGKPRANARADAAAWG
jgi:ubiquinone/menaquinone biosynthesis C-methylase UbiE